MLDRLKSALLHIAHCRGFHRSHIAAEAIYIAHNIIREERWLIPVFAVLLIATLFDWLSEEIG